MLRTHYIETVSEIKDLILNSIQLGIHIIISLNGPLYNSVIFEGLLSKIRGFYHHEIPKDNVTLFVHL